MPSSKALQPTDLWYFTNFLKFDICQYKSIPVSRILRYQNIRVSNKPAHTQDRPVLLRTFGALLWDTPGSYRVTPDLPRPLKPRGPASGSPGWDLGSGSNELKTALPCPSRDLRGPAPEHLGVL